MQRHDSRPLLAAYALIPEEKLREAASIEMAEKAVDISNASPKGTELGGDDIWVNDDAQLLEWGSKDGVNFVDRVACHATVRLTSIDPKHGTFQVRMQCQWAFRTLNPKGDTEISFRGVPGIRMPGLNVKVEESRIWKDLTATESTNVMSNTIFWRGTSIFFMDGFKKFNVKDFPFDRQVINLQQLDFVWRSAKDDDNYYNSMKVVWLRIETCSMLSEWLPEAALITPLNLSSRTLHEEADETGPPYWTKIQIELHIERHHQFYVRQIFFVTYMITLASCSPLAMPPTEDHMGDRLSVYGGGLLTLVAFKYGIMDHLPSVPYSTYTDDFLLYQIFTVTGCTFESLVVFRFNKYEITVDWIENCVLIVVFIAWSLYLYHAWCRKPKQRVPWPIVRKIEAEESLLSEQRLPDFFRPHSTPLTAATRSTASSSPTDESVKSLLKRAQPDSARRLTSGGSP
mmetsp:Transcript_20494/g.36829  ORF Transcript_20494/g.36829 Transcript_20494/m.36829 type:complete len:457 (-) Transcript_20494:58-1428(-)